MTASRQRHVRWATWVLGLVGLLSACAQKGDAIVDVRWTMGGTTCARAGVERISIALVRDDAVVAVGEAACDDGELAIEGVPRGRYTVQVFGFRIGSEAPAYSGQEAGVDVPKGGRVSSPVIFLQESPGALDLRWRFESGRLCRFEGATWVQVSVFDDRNRRVADQGLPCDPDPETGAPVVVPGSEYLEGAEGVVIENLFTGLHTIVILAYARPEDQGAAWGGEGTADISSFQLSTAEVVLSPCTDEPESPCR